MPGLLRQSSDLAVGGLSPWERGQLAEPWQLLAFLIGVRAGQRDKKEKPAAKIFAPFAEQRLNAEILAIVSMLEHQVFHQTVKQEILKQQASAKNSYNARRKFKRNTLTMTIAKLH